VERRTGRIQCTRYRCFDMWSVVKRRPELVVQTLAAIHARCWSFHVGRSMSGGVSSSACGNVLGCIFGLRPRNFSGNSRCRAVLENSRVCCGGP